MSRVLVAGLTIGASVAGAALWWRTLPFKLRFAVALRLSPRGVLLREASVPVALLIADPTLRSLADDEGLVRLDIHIADGSVAGVWPAGAAAPLVRGAWEVPVGGAILSQCFTDPHTHLVKTHAGPRCRNSTGSINGALAAEMDDKPLWETPGDIRARMDFALRTAWHHGTAAIRTHLDGTALDVPEGFRALVYREYDEARLRWGGKGLHIQGVANLYLPLWRTPEASQHAREASTHPGVMLGAYCGDVSSTPPADVKAAFSALFGHAAQHGLDVDLHIDETNNPECCAMLPLCESLQEARESGYRGHIALSHVTSLALQGADCRDAIIGSLSELAPLTVICCPNTNVYLQDRRGTMPPIGKAIPADKSRTPLWRGLTLVQELRAAGVSVAAASDNVRDWWYRYGDYDCLSLLASAMEICHLDTIPSEGAWADIVTCSPAALMGLPSCRGIRTGCPADLILFPGARKMSELLARPQLSERVVLREGRVQFSRLPQFSELDSHVATKTHRSEGQGAVQRGATSAL